MVRVKIQISFSRLLIFDHVEITGLMSAGINQIFNHFIGTEKGVGLPDHEGGQKDHSAIAQYYEYLTDIRIGR